MSTGVTLTAATTVVFAELHWTPGIMLQAEDRAHRIGQCCCVNVKYVVCKGTADDFMWAAFKRRLSVVSSVCNGDNDGVELEGVTEVTRRGGDAVAGLAASLDSQVGMHSPPHLLRNFGQARQSDLSSPSRKRRKSGSGLEPPASQPRIEMFMRQAPSHAATAPVSRPDCGFEQRGGSGAAATHDAVEAISDDDDAPMVAAGGLNAAQAAFSPLPAWRKAGGSVSAPSSCSLPSSATAQPQAFTVSERLVAAVESMRGAAAGSSSSERLAADSARASAAAGVVDDQAADNVLDMDDLDSLFCL
jgi:hypothetical protein